MSDAAAPGAAASLPLAALRRHRQDLEAEEDKVSYRRRLIHAQIDLLESGLSPASKFSVDDLVRVLSDSGNGTARRALVRVQTTSTLPAMPELTDVLGTDPDRDDPAQVAAALDKLRKAEHTLTEHRRALHESIDEATRELIGRYRAQPHAALAVIPQD